MNQTEYDYRLNLVISIEHQLGRSLALPVREAFLTVPRGLFVSHYYQQAHMCIAPATTDEQAWGEWLSSVYQDQALTTQVDTRGFPTSSTSQPSVMAVMLEQLALTPGMRVLEIGTGTGYNAALLAVLTGDPHLVTTVDIDPTLVEQARPRIKSVVGSGMTIVAWNGLDGYCANAPYDCIIATGSFLPVPRAWAEQLSSGGRLVMDLRGKFGGGLITFVKESNGTMVGQFLTGWDEVSFMGLRSALEEMGNPSLPKGYEQWPVQESHQLSYSDPAYTYAAYFCSYEEFYGVGRDINLWLQWHFPGLVVKWKGSPEDKARMTAILMDTSSQTIAKLKPETEGVEVVVYGSSPLWSWILECLENWQRAGKPRRSSLKVVIDAQGDQQIFW